ncbi:MAG TPA: 4'-phosphopantetheinyl transferase superfamily protein [Thermoanaerobaculia bacterium]|nr:4'-phosphopantetheinyl transferase superfamily protein [Thermoanaerobaculia bacterium]
MIPFPPRAAGAPLALPAGELHLWAAPLDPPAERIEELRALLAPDERARVERFRFEVHRRRFAVGRGVLRALLGAYLDVPPERLAFTYGERGKPDLAPGSAAAGPLHFNLSHSHELALLAVTREREVGADVEQLRPLDDLEKIAERFFSAAEHAQLMALPEAERVAAFFRCWTRKEAYLKALGVGLAAPLDAFVVTLGPQEPARMLTLEGDAERAARWALAHLEPAPRYFGAVAVEAAGLAVRAWTLAF